MKVVAIIQARMGSKRLPGKVLMQLGGYPVLEWIVEAVRNVELIDEVVVATSDLAEDLKIVEWCSSSNVSSFQGSSEDVLGRIRECARLYGADIVLRLTADCPMLDFATVSELVERGILDESDYFTLGEGFPDGLDCEGMTYLALDKCERNAKLPSEREHVTPYIKQNPNIFSQQYYPLWQGFHHLRLTLDEPADFELLNTLIEITGFQPGGVRASDLVQILTERPDLRAINAHILRNEGYEKSLANDWDTGYLLSKAKIQAKAQAQAQTQQPQ